MDKEEFVQRVQARERALYCIARTMLAPCDCEDAMQAAVLRAWEKLYTLRDEALFEPWLTRILCNECRQMLRKAHRESPSDVEKLLDQATSPPADVTLSEALKALRPQERLLLLLHHDEGYSLQEIASILNVPLPVIKMRMYRARGRLRTELEERGVHCP